MLFDPDVHEPLVEDTWNEDRACDAIREIVEDAEGEFDNSWPTHPREFIGVLRTLHRLGLDSKEHVTVGGVEVAPRDVVAACLPDPAALGDRMSGKTCAGT